MHFQWVARGPGPEGWACQPTPPDLVEKPEYPLWVLAGEADEPIPTGLLLGVVRVRAGHPEFGAAPLHLHPLQRSPDGFVAHFAIGDPEFAAGVGQELESPGARLLPKVAGTLVDQFL